MKEMTVAATVDNVRKVTEFVEETLEAYNCPPKAMVQIDIAIDELFTNVASYAYNPEDGPITVRVEVQEDPPSVSLSFIDRGVPFDPLAKPDPNVKLPIEERTAGGLGIFIVKNSMDDISYDYRDGQNILTIKKNLTPAPKKEKEK